MPFAVSFVNTPREDGQTGSLRGSKSRNKVSVGEPAEGSLPYHYFRAGPLGGWCGRPVQARLLLNG